MAQNPKKYSKSSLKFRIIEIIHMGPGYKKTIRILKKLKIDLNLAHKTIIMNRELFQKKSRFFKNRKKAL
jgi:hypothetical protein